MPGAAGMDPRLAQRPEAVQCGEPEQPEHRIYVHWQVFSSGICERV